MKSRIHDWMIPLGLVFSLMSGCSRGERPAVSGGNAHAPGVQYKRIVSLAPSITETLFALGLGDRVIGVTKFCKYPPEAAEKECIGGYVDPNYEKISVLEPDIVFLLPEHDRAGKYFDKLGIECKILQNKTSHDIIETIRTAGEMCGAKTASDSLIRDIYARMKAVRAKNAAIRRPRILISIGRNMGTGSVKDVFIAGKGTYFDELIRLAGGTNAYRGTKIPYPLLSAEGLMTINPDIVIDLVPDLAQNGLTKDAVMREWQSVGNMKAVRDSALFVLDGDYIVVPGPRFIILLENIAKIIHEAANSARR